MDRNSSNDVSQTRKVFEDVIVADVRKFFDQGQYDKCLASVDNALKKHLLDETRIILLCRKTLCYMKLNKFEKAEETLKKEALTIETEIGSSSHRTIYAQFVYLYGDWADSYVDSPDKKKYYQDLCLEWIDRCFNNGEKERYFLYNSMGDIMCDRENYKDALKAYNQAIRIQPKDFWAYRGIANVNFKMQKFDQSIKFYDQAISALEEKNKSSKKGFVARRRAFADIEKMKESREKVLESLLVSSQEGSP